MKRNMQTCLVRLVNKGFDSEEVISVSSPATRPIIAPGYCQRGFGLVMKLHVCIENLLMPQVLIWFEKHKKRWRYIFNIEISQQDLGRAQWWSINVNINSQSEIILTYFVKPISVPPLGAWDSEQVGNETAFCEYFICNIKGRPCTWIYVGYHWQIWYFLSFRNFTISAVVKKISIAAMHIYIMDNKV